MKQVSLGNLRYKSNVHTSDELGNLAQVFNVMTANLLEAQETKLAQRAMERELSLATKIQKKLLPSGVPDQPGYDIAHHYVPAREVGGDYFDFLKIDDKHIATVVADVSGKGIPASLIMTMTRSLLRVAAKEDASPVRTVELVNRFLTPDMNPGMFVTLVYVVLNLTNGEGRLVRAGHPPPLFYSHKRARVIPMQPRGMGLGLDRTGEIFESSLQVQRFMMQKGDVLVLYTDGVVEGQSREGKEYSPNDYRTC
jgi:sigma-B regulation protein RsbU (phosphoserine phosphatase)